MLGDIELLQQKPEGPNLQLGDFIIAPVDRKPEISVKRLRNLMILCGHKCLHVDYGTRKHCSLQRDTAPADPAPGGRFGPASVYVMRTYFPTVLGTAIRRRSLVRPVVWIIL